MTHDMAYGGFKEQRLIKYCLIKHLIKNVKHEGYQCSLASMGYTFFDK